MISLEDWLISKSSSDSCHTLKIQWWCLRILSFPEVFPASYFWKEGLSRAGGVVYHLSVSVDGEVSNQSSSIYCTFDEMMAQQIHSIARRQGGGVVTDDGHTIPDTIVPPGVCAEESPTSALVDVTIRANNKAESTKIQSLSKCIYPLSLTRYELSLLSKVIVSPSFMLSYANHFLSPYLMQIQETRERYQSFQESE